MNNAYFPGEKRDTSNNNSSLVIGIKRGEASAFEKLFNLYAKSMFNFAVFYVKHPQPAEDIVQEVFVNIWKNRSKLNPSLSIKSYLYKSVKNLSLKYLQHEKVILLSEERISTSVQPAQKPDEVYNETEFAAEVQKAVAELPERCRMIFLMHRDNGLTYSEIADILEISINTVKTQMSRAFTSLRQRLIHFFISFV